MQNLVRRSLCSPLLTTTRGATATRDLSSNLPAATASLAAVVAATTKPPPPRFFQNKNNKSQNNNNGRFDQRQHRSNNNNSNSSNNSNGIDNSRNLNNRMSELIRKFRYHDAFLEFTRADPKPIGLSEYRLVFAALARMPGWTKKMWALFDAAPTNVKHDAACLTSVIAHCSSVGDSEGALKLLDFCLSPSPDVIIHALRCAARDGNLTVAARAVETMSKFGLAMNVEIMHFLCVTFFRKMKWDKVRELIASYPLKASEGEKMAFSIMRAALYAKSPEGCAIALDSLEEFHCQVCVGEGVALLDVAMQFHSASLANKLWKSDVFAQVKSERVVQEAYADALLNSGQLFEALDAFCDAEANVPSSTPVPLPMVYVRAIATAIGITSHLDFSYYHLLRRHDDGRPVTISVLNGLVLACGLKRDVNRMVDTFEAIKKFDLSHDTISYNVLLEGFALSKMPDEVPKVWEELTSNNRLAPDENTYYQTIRCYARSGRLDEAKHWAGQMESIYGLSERSMGNIILELLRTNRRDEARELMGVLKKNHLIVSNRLNTLIEHPELTDGSRSRGRLLPSLSQSDTFWE